MDELTPAPRQARFDRALERLADNHSLRDDLDDAQAQALLGWATGRLRLRRRPADAAPDAAAYMDDQVLQLVRIMRQVNGLAPTLVYLVEDDLAAELLESFASSVAELTGYDPGDDWLDGVIASRPTLDPAQTFHILLDFLQQAVAAPTDPQRS